MKGNSLEKGKGRGQSEEISEAMCDLSFHSDKSTVKVTNCSLARGIQPAVWHSSCLLCVCLPG